MGHALDLLAIINLIMSSASLRNAESWTPVCLVHLNDKAYAYAYVTFVEDSDVGVVFLSTTSDGDQFHAISQQASTIKKTLKTSGCLTDSRKSHWLTHLRSHQVPRSRGIAYANKLRG